jgi:predicted membrane-bound mannosyltransferase
MQGAGHEKPWHYWLGLFLRYEPPALLGLLAAPVIALAAAPPIRLLALYGLGSFAAYSVIHYKTPWCVLELIWPLLFVAAAVIDGLATRSRPGLAAALTGALALSSLVPAVRVNFLRYADPAEPYVYVQTFPAALEPVRLLERAAARDPSLRGQQIHVLMKLSWPLPWLLAGFPRTGHWSKEQLPPGDAAVLFVDEPHRALVEARLHRRYFLIPFKLSPAHAQAYAYFDAERFAADVPAGTPTFTPRTE